MRSIPAAFVAAVLAGSAACTQSPTPTPGLASSPAAVTAQDGRPTFALTGTPSATRCGWDNDSGTDVPTYRGMTVVAAKARAISEGLKVRDRGADGECFLQSPITSRQAESTSTRSAASSFGRSSTDFCWTVSGAVVASTPRHLAFRCLALQRSRRLSTGVGMAADLHRISADAALPPPAVERLGCTDGCAVYGPGYCAWMSPSNSRQQNSFIRAAVGACRARISATGSGTACGMSPVAHRRT